MVASSPTPLSFDAFAAREFDQILALALASLRDEQDALDVAQETMARCIRAWDEVAAMDRPGAWARRVALNLVTDRLRARTRRIRLLDRLGSRGTESAPAVDDLVWDQQLWAEVADLPQRRREVVVLHYVLDLGVDEIAEILETPSGTVKSDLARAREHLRQRMGDVT